MKSFQPFPLDGPEVRRERRATLARVQTFAPKAIAKVEQTDAALVAKLPDTLWGRHIRRAARLGARLHHTIVREHERPAIPLRATQLDVLAVVAYSGPRHTIFEIARRLGLHRTTLSRSLSRLERHGFVRRSSHHADARRRLVEITELGRLAIRMNVDDAWSAQIEMAVYVKDGFDGIDRMLEGIKWHFQSARVALYLRGLRPEMFDDRPRGAPSLWADSTLAAQRRW